MKFHVVIFLSLAAAGGCATHKENGFDSVRSDVHERTGVAIQWDRFASQNESATGTLLKQPLTADSAVQLALLNNRRLQATYEELGIAQADLVQAGLLKNPVFRGDLKYSLDGGGTKIELDVVQDFLDVLFIPLRKQTAASKLEVAKSHVTAEAVDLAAETRRAVYALQRAEQFREIRQSASDADSAAFELSTRLRSAGNITELSLATQRAEFERSKLDLAAAENAVLDTRERLNILLGLWGSQTAWTCDARLSELPPTFDPPANVEQRAIRNSLALNAGIAELNGLARELGIRRTFGAIDSFELGVAAERENAGGWSAGPEISTPIPIFDTGDAAKAAAVSRFEQSRQRYYAEAVEIRSSARSAANHLAAAWQRANYIRTVVIPLRQEITAETQLQNNAMVATTFQLLEAKKGEFTAAEMYIDSLHDYWAAKSDLDKLTGGH